jgi:hypothetical protein
MKWIGSTQRDYARDSHGVSGSNQGSDISGIHHFIQNQDFVPSSGGCDLGKELW